MNDDFSNTSNVTFIQMIIFFIPTLIPSNSTNNILIYYSILPMETTVEHTPRKSKISNILLEAI